MTEKARQLLKNMASEHNQRNRNSFYSCFYLGYSKSVIDELEENGCIIRKNDIIASIVLTQFDNEEATM